MHRDHYPLKASTKSASPKKTFDVKAHICRDRSPLRLYATVLSYTSQLRVKLARLLIKVSSYFKGLESNVIIRLKALQ